MRTYAANPQEMSDNNLVIWPADPWYSPSQAMLEAAVALLREFVPEARSVEASSGFGVDFINCGQNIQAVTCPSCSADLLPSWAGMMQASFEKNDRVFSEIDAAMPCCGAILSLNDLRYDFPMGFATVWLTARNPGIPNLPREKLQQIADVMGAPLRATWQRI